MHGREGRDSMTGSTDPLAHSGGLLIHRLTSAIVDVAGIHVLPGRPVALVGASGSGKSSLLRAIVDLDQNEGDVQLDGDRRADLSAPEWRRRVTYIPAEPGWWGERVGDHLHGPAGDGSDDSRDMRQALGLSHIKADQPIEQLSTGERQRLALALGLARNPTALLLDEPTAALDDDNRAQVETILDPMIAAGLILIMATHDPEQARRLGLQRLEISAGRILPGVTDAPVPAAVEP